MYLARVPAVARALFPDLVWRVPTTERLVHLTFDDGPTPELTPWVLDQLRANSARATFFLVGRNAATHPGLVERIRREGHTVGNHTWEHANGWRTSTEAYVRSVERTQDRIGGRLFRPPYGRITRSQRRELRGRFDIIMWDVLSGDFDATADGARCLRNVTRHARSGSIIVFHDSLKAEARLRHALPLALAHFRQSGFAMRALPEVGIRAA